MRPTLSRRRFLKATGLAALAIPAHLTLGGRAAAQAPAAVRRLIIFYYPDGVPAASQAGDTSRWHPDGPRVGFQLPDLLSALRPYADDLTFFRGLTMGGTDEGSHPGGARKLLTAMDGGNGESIDRYLARTVGADRPHRHVYLGAMANQNNASGDKHISYPAAGHTTPPEDNPRHAFERLFGAPAGDNGQAPPSPDRREAERRRTRSLLDRMRVDLDDLRRGLGRGEQSKLDLHLDAIRELEQRIAALPEPNDGPARCDEAPGSLAAIQAGRLYEPEHFPAILEAQVDLLISAMACGQTRVGVVQASHHTSELIMSRFAGTPLHDPGFDMRSHQASHYGARHDDNHREFRDYLRQRAWFMAQYARLLGQLQARPEGEGTMLDHSLVLLCTEVCDGNIHNHADMPFILAGGRAAGVRTGQLLQTQGRRHADLLTAIAQAMGAQLDRFGDPCDGPLPGLRA